MLMQNFGGGQIRCIVGDVQVAYEQLQQRNHREPSFLEEEEEEEPLLIYTAHGSPFRRKKLSVNNGSPEQQRTKTTLNI